MVQYKIYGLLLFILITHKISAKVPICPHNMFDYRRASGSIISVLAPKDHASPIIAMDAYHNVTSCRYNKYCTFFDFCMAGAVNITYGRKHIEMVYYFFVKAMTRDDYTKVTQEITLNHLDDLRVKPLSVSFMPLDKSKIKIPVKHECRNGKVSNTVRNVCGSNSNAATSYSKEHGNINLILAKSRTSTKKVTHSKKG
ncbi:SWPV1-177 [Shearwaterpox virus]|uniref:SWPV1-177 n=1 Tax=Shearwaterpox virus TaxID=1974596 RepID=A0A1V0S7Z7_CNPV|nr:SWPV1-177 [Shearwaterpox virus]